MSSDDHDKPRVWVRATVRRGLVSVGVAMFAAAAVMPYFGSSDGFGRYDWLFDSPLPLKLAWTAASLIIAGWCVPSLVLAWTRISALVVADHGILIRGYSTTFIPRSEIAEIVARQHGAEIKLHSGKRHTVPTRLLESPHDLNDLLTSYARGAERPDSDRARGH